MSVSNYRTLVFDDRAVSQILGDLGQPNPTESPVDGSTIFPHGRDLVVRQGKQVLCRLTEGIVKSADWRVALHDASEPGAVAAHFFFWRADFAMGLAPVFHPYCGMTATFDIDRYDVADLIGWVAKNPLADQLGPAMDEYLDLLRQARLSAHYYYQGSTVLHPTT